MVGKTELQHDKNGADNFMQEYNKRVLDRALEHNRLIEFHRTTYILLDNDNINTNI